LKLFYITAGDVSLELSSQHSVSPTVDLGYYVHVIIELRMINLKYSVDGIVLLRASEFSVRSGSHQTVLTNLWHGRKESCVF